MKDELPTFDRKGAPPMEIVEVDWGAALVLAIKGRLDADSSGEAEEKLLAWIRKGYIHLALDLSQLEYIGCAGLRVLLTTLKKLKGRNGKVVIFGLSDSIRGILEVAGFTTLFSVYASAGGALAAFRWNHPLGNFIRTSRQGPNTGGYAGETIDIDSLHDEILRAAEEHGWSREPLLDEDGCRMVALSRRSPVATKSIYLSSGHHGDEPAPPLAIANLLWENKWPADWNIYICHCLNPAGFRLNQRGNAAGVDLNRDYCGSKSREVRAHVAWLESKPPFSMTVSLHEDWEAEGFYVYQLGPLAVGPVIDHILSEVAEICTIDDSPMIDHLPAEAGVLDLALHSLQMNELLIEELGERGGSHGAAEQTASIWSEAIYLINRKTKVSYTFESASAMPIQVRVLALTQAITALLTFPHEE